MTSRPTRLLALTAAAPLALACATARPAVTPVFYPSAPELPRIQYLTTFSGVKDVEKQSAFNRFVVGERLNIKLDKPYGVAAWDGKLYVCDTNTSVVVLDLKKRSFGPLKGAVGAGALNQPLNVSIEADGTKYVTDPVRGQVVVFDRNDAYVRAYGLPGAWRPVDAVTFQDRLYVADMANGVVKVFDKKSGELLKTIGDRGEPSDRLDRPTNLAFDQAGYLYVTDVGRFQVVVYDRDGHFKTAVGKPGDNLGHFARPKGVAVDREGRLFAVDASFNNVQIFNKDGRLLLFFGQGGDKPGDLLLPAKVAVDYDNVSYFREFVQSGFEAQYLVFVTSQFGERRGVSVFAYGQTKGRQYPSDADLLRQVDERRREELRKRPQPDAEASPVEPPPGQ